MEAKTGQHTNRSISKQTDPPATPVPYLSHSIEDILKRPVCLAEREMQKIEENMAENIWTPIENEDFKSSGYAGNLLLNMHLISFPYTEWLICYLS